MLKEIQLQKVLNIYYSPAVMFRGTSYKYQDTMYLVYDTITFKGDHCIGQSGQMTSANTNRDISGRERSKVKRNPETLINGIVPGVYLYAGLR